MVHKCNYIVDASVATEHIYIYILKTGLSGWFGGFDGQFRCQTWIRRCAKRNTFHVQITYIKLDANLITQPILCLGCKAHLSDYIILYILLFIYMYIIYWCGVCHLSERHCICAHQVGANNCVCFLFSRRKYNENENWSEHSLKLMWKSCCVISIRCVSGLQTVRIWIFKLFEHTKLPYTWTHSANRSEYQWCHEQQHIN